MGFRLDIRECFQNAFWLSALVDDFGFRAIWPDMNDIGRLREILESVLLLMSKTFVPRTGSGYDDRV